MPYEIFITNINNAIELIYIAKGVEDIKSKQLLYRSTIVLSVAHWQNFNEELIRQYAGLIQKRSVSSENLPSIVRKEIGKWIMQREAVQNHPDKFAKLIWEYAGGVWKKHYGEFAEEKIKDLNTPNSKNLINLYQSILGIKNIAGAWATEITAYDPAKAIDLVLEKRHEIAHGRSFVGSFSENELYGYINVLKDIAKVSYSVASDETSKILENCGTSYTLDSFNLKGLIKWLADMAEPKTFKVTELSNTNNSWYANHSKLSYNAWGLLEGSRNQRTPTDRFNKFIAGEIAIPYEIISFGGADSIAKQGTQMVYFKDL